ncbi:MAG: rod shape-determining protein [Cytophagales bacterium]|nr:rod shape-determining protein [Cytophagales bacterium]
MEKFAIIDLGTNTFNLLLLRVDAPQDVSSVRVEHMERHGVRLGEGGINEQRILPEASDRAVKTLRYFTELAEKHGVPDKNIVATGTSAVRNADNRQDFLHRVNKETGLRIQVLDGQQEASLIYEGVCQALSLKEENSMIVDIGGGSVEYIICSSRGVLWQKSIEMGGQRMMELFHRHEPILPSECRQLEEYFDKMLPELLEAIACYSPVELIGSSGTFETLAAIYERKIGYEPDTESRSSFWLPVGQFELIHSQLVKNNLEERLIVPGMIPLRAKMIVVASCLVKYLVKQMQTDMIRISSYALKEGVMKRVIEGSGFGNPI